MKHPFIQRPSFGPPRPQGAWHPPPFSGPMNMVPQGRPILHRPQRLPLGGLLPPPIFRGPPPPPIPPPFQRPPLIRTPPARFHPPFGIPRLTAPPFPESADIFSPNGTKINDFSHKMEAEFNKPWISANLKDEILKKHKLHQKARKSKNPETWDEFREQRNKVTAMLREAKLTFQGSPSLPKKDKKFFCDTCDRAYETQEQLDEHFQQHVKCGRNGCQFEAHTKIVELHVKMQHDSGYALKIMQLTTPEEIIRWREERKKNFPTKESVKQRQKEQSEQTAHGEMMKSSPNKKTGKRPKHVRGRGYKNQNRHPIISPGMPNRGRFPGRGFGQPFRGKMVAGRGIRGGRFGMKNPFLPPRSNPLVNNGLRKFSGTNNIINDEEVMDQPNNPPTNNHPLMVDSRSNFIDRAPRVLPNQNVDPMSYMFAADVDGDSDDGPIEEKIERAKVTNSEEPTVGGALGLLMNSYGGDTESENENSKINRNKNRRKRKNKFSNCKTDEQNNKDRVHSKIPRLMIQRHQLSLLEKLLAREIQHERNVILQCIQYVIKNNFFGIENDPR